MDLSQFEGVFQNHRVFWAWAAIILVSLALAVTAKLVLRFISGRLRRLATRTTAAWDDVVMDLCDGLRSWVLFVWVFYLLSKSLELSEFAHKILLVVLVLASGFQAGLWGLYVIKRWRQIVLDKRITSDPSSAAALGLLYTTVQCCFLVLIFLIALSNLGVNITALVTGLGVGGIAVALAAQNILGDLLASLSIVLDKPFVVGDFIITKDSLGTVENIGIKTTRLRSLSGEQLVIANKDLVESRVQNYKRMWQRRVVQGFSVGLGTPAEQLEQIPKWVRGFIEKHDKLKFDRCHFAKFGSSSLDFEFVFYVLDADYNIYMDHQQTVLIDILRKFEAEKIGFAIPAQTFYVEKFPAIQPSTSAPQPLPTAER